MPRPSAVVINLGALYHNCQYIKQIIKPAKLMAVIKANAYGHGATSCAAFINDIVDGFAVAFSEEAIELRQAKITSSILVLEGFFDAKDLDVIVNYNLEVVIHSFEQIKLLATKNLSAPITVWLKLDSGMGRLGFTPAEYQLAWQQVNNIKAVKNIIIMSHFASAHELNNNYSEQQIAIFNQTTSLLPGEISFCNSAATINNNMLDNWKRIGLALYGISPFEYHVNLTDKLIPVMELTSAIISYKIVPKGQKIGYGGIAVTKRTTVIGVVAIGYADGYPRLQHPDAYVLIHNKRAPIIGQVSMDMLTVDITEIPNIKVGDKVLLWGKQLPVSDVAKWSGLIPWQLLCNLNRVKVAYQVTPIHKQAFFTCKTHNQAENNYID